MTTPLSTAQAALDEPRLLHCDAVLFDLDGTLADTAPDLAAAVHKMQRVRDLPETPLDLLRPLASKSISGNPQLPKSSPVYLAGFFVGPQGLSRP